MSMRDRFGRFARTALLGALALFAAADAFAGAAPRLERVDPEEAFAGGVVKILGTNFSDSVADVAVTVVGGEKCSVLATTPTEVMIMLPTALKKGKYSLEVQVGPERSNRIEVKILPEEERAPAKARELEAAEGAGGGPQTRYLTLDAPTWSRERGTDLINVTGKALYPDGSVIQIEMRLDNALIANTEATVAASAFRAQFGPYDRQLFAGHYEVIATFHLMRQPGKIRKAFKTSVTDPKQAAEMQQAHSNQFVRVGSALDEQWQAKELKGHFTQTLARAKELLRELENNYAATGRSLFRQSDGKVDEAAWEKWLSKRSLRGLQGDELQARLAELRKGSPFLNKDNSFNDQAWREWLDFKWREDGVLRMVKDHLAYRDRYVVMKHHEEMMKLGEIFAGLVRLSMNRSRELYSGNGLPAVAADLETKDSDLARIGGSMGAISPGILESLSKKILKAIGAEEGAAAEK